MNRQLSVITGMLLTLAGCGGGNGGSEPSNSAPTFTSSAVVSAAENNAGAIYTAAATDPDGDTVMFSISGGSDAALFQISAGGALSFRAPPNFEAPGDANRDNVYGVVLTAGDGEASTTLPLSVTVTDVTTGGVEVRRIGTGFVQPVFVAALPDSSGRVLVVEREGRIRILNPATGAIAPTPFLDISGQISIDGERGLLSVALAPDFMTSGKAYIFVTASDGAVQLRRYSAPAGSREMLDPASGDVLLSIPHPLNIHNGGWLGFDRAGLLYMAVGDGGAAADANNPAQSNMSLLGKVLRLDVSGDDFPNDPNRDYIIPADNPFTTAGTSFSRPEIWLKGLRNPFRASFDRITDELWIGDVGQNAVEEVDRVRFTARTSLNLGWPLFEGTQPLLGTIPTNLTMPVTEYGHGGGPLQGDSITGGYVYRGPAEALQGLYIFADFIRNNIWSVPIAGLTPGTTTASTAFTNRNAAFRPNEGSLTLIVSFGEDQSGNLLIVSFGGDVFMLRQS